MSGGKGNSRANTSSQSSTQNTQTTVNQVDNSVQSGAGSVRGDNNTVIATDLGAIQNATDIAKTSIAAAEHALDSNGDVSRYALESNRTALEDSLDFTTSFGERAFSSVDKALAGIEGTQQDALSFAGGLFNGVTDFIGRLQEKSQDTLSSTVSALNSISVEQNKSTDQRVAEISQNAIKYVIIGLSVLVIGAGIAYASRRK